MHECLAILSLLLLAAARPQAAIAAAADPLELHATCDRQTPDSPRACLELGRMYLEGRGVERSIGWARELAARGCGPLTTFRDRPVEEIRDSEQACFTGFLWGGNTPWRAGNRDWQFILDVTLGPQTKDRLQRIAGSRSQADFDIFLDPAYDEIKALPDLPDVQKAMRARIVEMAHSDPDPVNRSYCAEVYDYIVGWRGLEEMARLDPDPDVRRVAARVRAEPEVQVAAMEADSATVLKAKDADQRRRAVQVLSDQAGLAKAAQTDPAAAVRAAAAGGLKDQRLLARIAEKDEDLGVRITAAAGLKDVAALERLVERSPDADIRQVAVEKIDNQAVLARVAERDPEYPIREQAIRRLTDQAALKRIATHKARGLRRGELRKLEASAIRATAVARLDDQGLLFDLATKDTDEKVCLAAMDALKDQRLLLEVLARRPGQSMARAVAERLRDQAALRSFLESQPDPVARVTAAGHITDTALAVEVAKSDPDATVVRMALSRIKDQAVLLQLARGDAPPVARAAAVAQLADRAVLRELERSSPYPEVRGAVQAKLLDDPAEAGRYATSEDPAVRRVVAGVVADQQLLKELAKDPDPFVRQEAIGRMTDRAALSELARAAPQDGSRRSAESRLRELNRAPTRFELCAATRSRPLRGRASGLSWSRCWSATGSTRAPCRARRSASGWRPVPRRSRHRKR